MLQRDYDAESDVQAHVMSDHARKFLSFTLGPEEYGVDILKAQEIRGYTKPTALRQ